MEDQSSTQLVVKTRKSKKVQLSRFAPCMKVIIPGKEPIYVPIDRASSDAQRSILVSKARQFVEDHLERLSSASLTPAEVKDLVKAVTDMDALQREQYVTGLNNRADSSFGKAMGEIVKNAAAGAAAGTADAFAEKMKKMDEAAKKAVAASQPKKVEAIEV